MIRQKLDSLASRQFGFSLVELIIVLAIVGILGTAIVMSVSRLFWGSSTSNNTNTAINYGRIAGEWFMRDAEMAQSLSDLPGAATLPSDTGTIQFIRLDPDNNIHKIEYSMLTGTTDLKRTYYIDYSDDSPDQGYVLQGDSFTVAEFVTSVVPSFNTSTTLFSLTITVSAPLPPNDKTETRTFEYQVKPRVY